MSKFKNKKLIRHTVWQTNTDQDFKKGVQHLLSDKISLIRRLYKLKRVLVKSYKSKSGVEITEWLEIK